MPFDGLRAARGGDSGAALAQFVDEGLHPSLPTGEIVGLLHPALKLRHDPPAYSGRGMADPKSAPTVSAAPVRSGFAGETWSREGAVLTNRRLLLALAAFVGVAATIAATAVAGGGGPAATLPVRSTTGDTLGFAAEGGATPLADARTVDHWSSSFTDPTNGVTYPFTMAGHAPSTNSSSTTPTDLYPVRVEFAAQGGFALDGTNRVAAVQASPIFQDNDYSYVNGSSGGPGVLSPGNVGQLEDVTMRSQFNKVQSSYHVLLGQPVVHPTVTIQVPASKGSAFVTQTGTGVIYGLVDTGWFSSKVQEILGKTQADPTHLPIVLTDNVMLFDAKTGSCCTIGYHGASSSANGNGKQPVQTYIFAAYSARGVSASKPYIADIHGLSHEVAEWGDDPFLNNWVNPWLTPTGLQYGCTPILETGDPVVGVGFNLGGNTFDAWNPNADGTWHPEDEALLPWFARTSPNTTSEPTQSPSKTIGRYTLMGDLNPYPGFRQPATGC
jgi:hypothetical protein